MRRPGFSKTQRPAGRSARGGRRPRDRGVRERRGMKHGGERRVFSVLRC